MIKKTFAVGFILFAAYSVFVHFFATEEYVPQSIQQDNSIKIQEFFYSEKAKENIVVGSSVAAKLDAQIAQSTFYNLAFRGQSVLDGLTIIKANGQFPKTILIETNTLQRAQSTFEDDPILNPGIKTVTGWLPALQQKNQPVNRFLLFLDKLRKKPKKAPKEAAIVEASNEESQPADSKPSLDNVSEKEKDFLERVVKRKISEYDELMDDESKAQIKENLDQLQEFVRYFQDKGVKFVFFEMPSDPRLMESKGFVYLRNEVRKTFPLDQFTYIKDVDPQNFLTKDGVHLVPESAKRYTQLLVKEFENITPGLARGK